MEKPPGKNVLLLSTKKAQLVHRDGRVGVILRLRVDSAAYRLPV